MRHDSTDGEWGWNKYAFLILKLNNIGEQEQNKSAFLILKLDNNGDKSNYNFPPTLEEVYTN